MGMFSWCCAKSDQSIPATGDFRVVVILPDNCRVVGPYDGYGRILNPRVFDGQGTEITLSDLGVVLDEDGEFDIYPAYGSHLFKELSTRNDAFVRERFDRIMESVKLVYEPYFYGERYEDLPVSKDCPYQGFGYGFESRAERDDPDEFLIGDNECRLDLAYQVFG